MNGCIQIVSAFLGSLGFGIVFRMKRRRLAFACLGGGVTWILYVLCEKYALSLFVSNFIATVFASAYAKVVAKHTKSPEIIYIITAVVPPMPGGPLSCAATSRIESIHEQPEQFPPPTGVRLASIRNE
ncbi:MAG: threonine/serine exporter family protein [Treponema sp.]|uniref:threonine/serine exporter family protein n=1 Tax=Treponema sp. TaxID=166 RepID=UPI00298E91EC|nr:threonine/serine exporter family protein [Treponema sp.]MCQ2601838.1 threonine/serine exporter family protein [Treponema sp.]